MTPDSKASVVPEDWEATDNLFLRVKEPYVFAGTFYSFLYGVKNIGPGLTSGFPLWFCI